MQLWAATQSAPMSTSSSSIWPQGPLAATPDILDILGSFHDAAAAKLRPSE